MNCISSRVATVKTMTVFQWNPSHGEKGRVGINSGFFLDCCCYSNLF
jgi:hypothetical protein